MSRYLRQHLNILWPKHPVINRHAASGRWSQFSARADLETFMEVGWHKVQHSEGLVLFGVDEILSLAAPKATARSIKDNDDAEWFDSHSIDDLIATASNAGASNSGRSQGEVAERG
jgi:hypothetical protein